MAPFEKSAKAADDAPGETPRGAARREDILKAASDVLIERGYAEFSARAVAAKAGLRLSHVQYYFASPIDIIVELLDRFIREYGDAVLLRFKNAKGAPEARLLKALEFLLNDKAYQTACGLFMLEVSGLAARNAVIAAALASYYKIYLDALADMLRVLNPDLAPAERLWRARHCLALIEGMSMTARHLGKPGEIVFRPRETARAILRLATAE
jgi:AcrR family transcriptional regulator